MKLKDKVPGVHENARGKLAPSLPTNTEYKHLLASVTDTRSRSKSLGALDMRQAPLPLHPSLPPSPDANGPARAQRWSKAISTNHLYELDESTDYAYVFNC